MPMEKRGEVAAFLIYFVLLLLLDIIGIISELNFINLIYLVVVLSCSLKFILIVYKDRE